MPKQKQPLTEEQSEWIKQAAINHPPDLDQQFAYQEINSAFIDMATAIYQNVPPSADRTDALRKLQEVKMTANQAIALRGLGIAR
jgi:pyridoxine 5'-phosphate synthase PdxJ